MLSPLFNTRNLASDFFNDWDQVFNAMRTPGLPTYDEREFAPSTDVYETEESYKMVVDLPGMKKEDIKIEVADNTLHISGERKNESTFSDDQTHRIERSYGSFKRSFTLPKVVSAENIEAHYENGVLELILPKTQLAQAKKIEIQAGKKEKESLKDQ